MADGKSLEHVGVTPDEVVLPSPDDLVALRDPALARAVELAGEKLDAGRAGKMFPVRWK
jgi:C-terminal processing protease CtpA/Prc